MTQKTISELQAELLNIQQRIKRAQPSDAVLDNMPARIGGSGRYTNYFNKRREAYLERTIKASHILTDLYKQENLIKAQISKIEQEQKDIESGAAAIKAQKRERHLKNLAQYWRNLKVGDELPIGNPNGNPNITKKNKKSAETGTGCVWQAWEIIGKEAAKLI